MIGRLTQAGIAVWRDTASMPAGVQWQQQVADAIRGADLVVMCTSQLWYGSRACRDEEDWANYYSRPSVKVPVDQGEFDLERAMQAIGAAWHAITPEDRLASDLETAAGNWSSNGHHNRDLARGSDLSSFRKAWHVQRGADAAGVAMAKPSFGARLTPVALRYLRQSIRRQRVTRVLAALAVIVLVVAGLSAATLATRMKEIREAGDGLNEDSRTWSDVRAALRRDPYQAMEVALSLPHDAATMRGSSYVAKLQTILAAHVPSDHGKADDARFGRFAFDADASTARARFDGGNGGVPMRAWVAEQGNTVLIAHDTERQPASDADEDAQATGTVSLPSRATMLAFSPDGLYLAALGDTGITIIDPAHASAFMTLTGADTSQVTGMSWSADGSRLAIRTSDGTATVWSVRSNTTIVSDARTWYMDGAALGGKSANTTGSGTQAAFLARDGSVTVVDTATGKVRASDIHVPVDVGVTIAGGADANTAYVIGQKNGALKLYRVDLQKGASAPLRLPEDCTPQQVTPMPGGKQLAVSCGTRIIVTGASGGKALSSVESAGASVSAMKADEQGRLFVGFDNGQLAILEKGQSSFSTPDAAEAEGNRIGLCVGGAVRGVAVSGNKALFVGDGTIAQNCSRNISRSKHGDGGQGGVSVSGKDDGSWTMHVGMTNFAGLSDADQARAVAASPDGSAFVAGLSDGSIAFARYDMQPGAMWREVPGEIRAVIYSDDGKRVFAATRDGLIIAVPAITDSYEGADLRKQVRSRLDTAVKLGLYQTGKSGSS